MSKLLKRADLQRAAHAFALACEASRQHDRLAGDALARYGSQGPDISGAVRSHFPENVKDELRALARAVGAHSDIAYSVKPKRVRLATMRALARAVATRDGTGFYGPQSGE